jgi:hypothetical protein
MALFACRAFLLKKGKKTIAGNYLVLFMNYPVRSNSAPSSDRVLMQNPYFVPAV